MNKLNKSTNDLSHIKNNRLNNRSKSFGETPNQFNIFNFDRDDNLRLGTQSLIQVIQAFTRHSNQNLIDEDQTDFNNFLNNNRKFSNLYSSLHTVHKPSITSNNQFLPSSSSSSDESSTDTQSKPTRPPLLRSHTYNRKQNLSQKLAEIFNLNTVDQILSEYRCCLLGSSYRPLLEGFLYCTFNHICFFAHVPSTSNNQIIKSGHLSKRTLRTRRILSYWFVLKDDVLSWFQSSTDPYFPIGNISLTYAIKCTPIKGSENEFIILTSERKFSLIAENKSSRNHWVKVIRKGIFRSKNESGSFKLVVPFNRVNSIQRSSNFEFSDCIALDFVNNDDGNDVYYFDHFNNSQIANEDLNSILVSHKNPTFSNEFTFSPSNFESDQYFAPPNDRSLNNNNELHTYPPNADNKGKQSHSKQHSLSDISIIPSMIKSGSLKLGKAVYQAPKMIPHPHLSSLIPRLPYIPFISTSSQQQQQQQQQQQIEKEKSFKIYESYEEPHNINNADNSDHGNDEIGNEDNSDYSILEHSAGMEDILKVDEESHNKFNEYFSLKGEKILGHFNCALFRVYPIPGKVFITENYLCFRSFQIWSRTKMILPLKDLQSTRPHKPLRFSFYGLVMIIKRHEELFLEFTTSNRRNSCLKLINKQIENNMNESLINSNQQLTYQQQGLKEAQIFEELTTKYKHPSSINSTSKENLHLNDSHSLEESLINFKPNKSLKITCLTIGSRGDIQPYIALCIKLNEQGHQTKIATHGEYKHWIESFGIEHCEVGGDPAELMRICVEHGTFTLSFLREGLSKFREWLDELLKESWIACQNTDLLIESPSAMAGIHIAEALQIPYFRAFTMTWTRTRAYPHAFAVPDTKLGGSYNYMTYTIFDQVFWRAISGQINKWRRNTLNLNSTNLNKLAQYKVPFLYCLSPHLVPKPLDWNEWIHVTGYWFLDEFKKDEWKPPTGLMEFMNRGRKLNKKIIYIGFGSIVVNDPKGLTKCVIEAIKNSDVFAILSKGWSDRLFSNDDKNGDNEKELYPDYIFPVQSIDHSHLFPLIDAAVHHGGSGTTGASLRAGIPTIIKPFFGDQFFNADRVEAIGVGSCVRRLTVESLTEALKKATSDEKQIMNAKNIGEKIRQEDGVSVAINCLYRYLDYALSVIRSRRHKTDHDSDEILTDDENYDDSDEAWSIPSTNFINSEDESDNNYNDNSQHSHSNSNVISLAASIGKKGFGSTKEFISKKL